MQQRNDFDCAICCFAMLTARPYEDVLATVDDLYDPSRGVRREQEALKRLGYKDGDFRSLWHGPLAPEYFRNFAWGRRALMTVASLNFPDADHMIYFDGAAVHDPSRRERYTTFDTLKPTEITIFRESR